MTKQDIRFAIFLLVCIDIISSLAFVVIEQFNG